MRRVCRHLFTLCAAASLVLCVAVCVVWAQSYFRSHEFEWTTVQLGDDGSVSGTYYTWVRSSRGWWSSGHYCDDPDHWKTGRAERSSFEWRQQKAPLQIEFDATRYSGNTPVPYWLTVLVLLALPVYRVAAPRVRAWQAKRRLPGHCATCGYDLRATPGRCPECGTAAA